MLSFHIKFVQTDRQTDGQMDNGKTIYSLIFRYRGIKIFFAIWLDNISKKHSAAI